MRKTVLSAMLVLSAFAVATTAAAGGKTSPAPRKAVACVTKCVDFSPVPWYKVIAMYPANRVLDAMDIFRVSLSAGPGVGVNARTTNLIVATGAGNYCTTNVGMKGRVLPAFEDTVNECGLSVLGNTAGNLQNDPTEVGVTAHALLGANLAVSVAEVVDFAAGIIMLDPQADDLTPSMWD